MKIALELQPCCGQRSGIGTYVYELAKRMVDTSELNFYGNVFNFSGRNNLSASLLGIPYPIHTNRLMPYGVYRRIWHVAPVSYEMCFPRADLTHFFNYIVPPRIKGRVINTVYDLSYLNYPETLDPKNLRRIKRDIQYSMERSEKIVTISQCVKKELLDTFSIAPSQVEIISPSFARLEATVDFNVLCKKFSIEHPYILYMGNLEPRKNLVRLVEAFSQIHQKCGGPFQLVLAGKKGWLYNDIFQTVERLNLTKSVLFTNYITEAEKGTLYRNARVFAFPSIYEGFGIPILEAMSAGAPVLSSNTSSMPEVAGNAAVLVDPFQVEEMADGLYGLLTDEDLRAEKIAAGYMQAAKFSWDDSAQKLLQLYESLL